MYKRYRHFGRDKNMSAHDDLHGQEDNADKTIYGSEDNLIYFDIVEGNSEISVKDILERIETMDTSGVKQQYGRLVNISEVNEDITHHFAERLKAQDRFAEAEMSTFELAQDDNDIWTQKLAAVSKQYKNYRGEAKRIKREHLSYERESDLLEERTETMQSDVRKIVENLDELVHRRDMYKELAVKDFDTLNCEVKDLVKENEQNYKMLDSLRNELNLLKIKELEEKDCCVSNTVIGNKIVDVLGVNRSDRQVGNLTVVSSQMHKNRKGKGKFSDSKQNNAERPNTSICPTTILKGNAYKFENPTSKALPDINKEQHNRSIRHLQASENETISPYQNQRKTDIIVDSVNVKAPGCDNSERRPIERLSERKTQRFESIHVRPRMTQINRRKQADIEGTGTTDKSIRTETKDSTKDLRDDRFNGKTETAALNDIAKMRRGWEEIMHKGDRVQRKLDEDLVILSKTCRNEDTVAVSTSSKVDYVHSKSIPAIVSPIVSKTETDKFSRQIPIVTDNTTDITQGPLTPDLLSVESQKTTKPPLLPIVPTNMQKGTRKLCKIGSVSAEDALPSITPSKVVDDHGVICVVPVSSPRPVYAMQTGEKFEIHTPHKAARPLVKSSNLDKRAARYGNKGSNTTMKLVGNGKPLTRR